jgi:hypothetical protein
MKPQDIQYWCYQTFILIVAIFYTHPCRVRAMKARPLPFQDIDQDGQLTPPIYLRGDESFHWEEDQDGYTLTQDPIFVAKRGRKKRVYAKVENGELVSSGIVFGSHIKKKKIRFQGLTKHVKPSEQIRRFQCGTYCESGAFNQTKVQSLPIDNRRNHQEHSNRRRLLSNQSSLKNLALLIRFVDHQNRVLPPPSHYEVLLNGPAGLGTIAPTGSVNDVFLANSYGKFQLNSTITHWITVNKTEAYYADGKSGLGPKIFEVC